MAPPKPVNVPAFATTQLALLDAELLSEIDETSALLSSNSNSNSSASASALALAGLAITNLTVAAMRTGLGGKTVMELGPDAAVSGTAGDGLAEHGIRVGDIVAVAEQTAASARRREAREARDRGLRGVVVRVARAGVAVALEEREDGDVPGGRLWVVKLANDVTYKR
jgi:DNA polymerase alpha-associated DNA helicase A